MEKQDAPDIKKIEEAVYLMIAYASKPVMSFMISRCEYEIEQLESMMAAATLENASQHDESDAVHLSDAAQMSELKSLRDSLTALLPKYVGHVQIPIPEYGEDITLHIFLEVSSMPYELKIRVPNDSYHKPITTELSKLQACAFAFVELFKKDYSDLWLKFVRETGCTSLEETDGGYMKWQSAKSVDSSSSFYLTKHPKEQKKSILAINVEMVDNKKNLVYKDVASAVSAETAVEETSVVLADTVPTVEAATEKPNL